MSDETPKVRTIIAGTIWPATVKSGEVLTSLEVDAIAGQLDIPDDVVPLLLNGHVLQITLWCEMIKEDEE